VIRKLLEKLNKDGGSNSIQFYGTVHFSPFFHGYSIFVIGKYLEVHLFKCYHLELHLRYNCS
jgi:hypothetical protein